jgi:hypothetical protein
MEMARGQFESDAYLETPASFNRETRESSSTLMIRRCRRLPRISLPLIAADERLQCRHSAPQADAAVVVVVA